MFILNSLRSRFPAAVTGAIDEAATSRDALTREAFASVSTNFEARLQIRAAIAKIYLQGRGIEIGALNLPLQVPERARVKYVDRFRVSELRKHYPEFDEVNLIDPDIIDDGEQLATFADESQDFVIANHFLEHCENPICAIENFLRVLMSGGILYMAVPDKRDIFDRDRRVTPFEHIARDYAEGPEWSKRTAFEEWVRFVNKVQDDEEVHRQVARLMQIEYSIHYHVWTEVEIMEMLATLRKGYGMPFEVEMMLRLFPEVICVLRKI